MTQDIKQRVEAVLIANNCNYDHERYEACWTCFEEALGLIQELKEREEKLAEEIAWKKKYIEIATDQLAERQLFLRGYAAREEKLVACLRTIILTGDKVSMIKTAKTTLSELGINPTNGE